MTSNPPPYEHVAVAVDGSERALEALGPARNIARLLGVGLWLVTVEQPGDRTGAEAILSDARAHAGDLVSDTTVLTGEDPASALGRFDDEHPEALLCLTTRSRRPTARTLLGSVATGVVAHSNQAVLLIGPRCQLGDEPINRIVVSLDGSPEGEAILPWATLWSDLTSLPLILVHVVYPLVPPEARVPPTQEQMDELSYLPRLARQLEGDGHDVAHQVIQHPDAVDAIVDVTQDFPQCLVAAASADRQAFSEVFARSTTASVLRTSPAPVLVASRPI